MLLSEPLASFVAFSETSIRFLFITWLFLAQTGPQLDTLSMEFLHVASQVILDLCNIKMFIMVELH